MEEYFENTFFILSSGSYTDTILLNAIHANVLAYKQLCVGIILFSFVSYLQFVIKNILSLDFFNSTLTKTNIMRLKR